MQHIASAFTEGGIFMYVILLVSVFGLGVIIERFVFLFFKLNINASAFMAQIEKLVRANNIGRAVKLCNAAPNAALPKVIKAGLIKANKGEKAVADAIEAAILQVVPQVRTRTAHLQGIANIATLMELLGTIWGLIEAFAALDVATPDQRASYLARGISMAMNTTAFGLIVAIPCMIAHLFLSSVTRKIVDEIEGHAVKLEILLGDRRDAEKGNCHQ